MAFLPPFPIPADEFFSIVFFHFLPLIKRNRFLMTERPEVGTIPGPSFFFRPKLTEITDSVQGFGVVPRQSGLSWPAEEFLPLHILKFPLTSSALTFRKFL